MKRGGYLQRRTRLNPRRAKPRRSGRALDPGYLEFVRGLPCCAPLNEDDPCWGPIDPHHAGPHPMGRKADDDTCIPLCRKHHGDVDAFAGPFAGMSRWVRAEFYTREIARVRALFAVEVAA